jgi:hypothetical protein
MHVMVVSLAPVPTVEDIVDGLRDHVWTLVRAHRVDAALILLEASVEEFLQASSRGEPAPEVLEGIVMDDERPGGVMVHVRRPVVRALAC